MLLRNTSERTIDAILRADFRFPLSGDALVRFRLAPLEERLCTVEGPEVRFMGWPDQRGSKLKSIELVDWSALIHEQPGQAEALLRGAFEARAKWPTPDLTLEADYTAELENYDFASNKRVKATSTGRFRTMGKGFVSFEPKSGPIILGTSRFGSATLRLAQKPFTEWLGAATVWIHTSDADTTVVGVLRARDKPGSSHYFWIQNGELGGEVRAAWERAYRFPDQPLEVTGHFRMTNAGNDLVWRGHELVEGRFHMRGLVGVTWQSATIELEGTYTEKGALALDETVRDLTARPSFASQFMGARFEQQGSKILVTGCSVRELELKRGQLVTHAQIRELKPLGWKKSKGGELLTRTEYGAEKISFQRENIDGVWLATRIKMTGIFDDWEPEQVELSDLRVERR